MLQGQSHYSYHNVSLSSWVRQFGLFHSLEEYADISILAVGIIYFIFFLDRVSEVSTEFICYELVACNISIVIWIL
jgi:hypothetical protein